MLNYFLQIDAFLTLCNNVILFILSHLVVPTWVVFKDALNSILNKDHI